LKIGPQLRYPSSTPAKDAGGTSNAGIRDESILGIPIGPMEISREWESLSLLFMGTGIETARWL